MSSQEVTDFLTKQLFIEKNIVTYRSLSRQFAIHVNAAKNELATYHANAAFQSQVSSATYLLSGTVLPYRSQDERGENKGMDEEEEGDGDDDNGEDVPQMKITLANERDLEAAKSQYSYLNSIHVYSLAPSPIRDAGLICGPTEAVRQVDSEKGPELAVVVGKIVGKNIQVKAAPSVKPGKGTLPPKAGPSKPKLAANRTTSLKDAEESIIKASGKSEDQPKEKKRPKPTGKLDFSKAKTKDVKKEEPKTEKKEEDFVKPPPTSDKGSEKTLEQLPVKRGTKRKPVSTFLSDSEDGDEPSAAQSKYKAPSAKPIAGPRVRKGVVLSEDEGFPQPSRRKSRIVTRSPNIVDSEAERDLQAMMDVDDDQVIRVSRDNADPQKEEEETEDESITIQQDEDVTMSDNIPKPKARKRKEKKVVPIGRNGLKKKRVVKSRTAVDAKGYMLTEDYSSYESADEDGEPESKPAKGKAKGNAKASAPTKEAEFQDPTSANSPKPKQLAKASAKASPPAKGAKAGGAKGGQKNLANFFAPAPAKPAKAK